ncbi:MAG: PE-PGRS family protein, partial [Dyadobacter sp.]
MKLYKVRFKIVNILFFITIAGFVSSCGDSEVDPVTGRSSDFEMVPQKFPVTPGIINEASALASSFTMTGYIWTLLDSGNPNSVYLLSTDGKTIKEFNIPGSINHDWEAMASGPGPAGGTNYLYIGETGNNNPPMTATNIIYRVPEISDISGSFSQDKLEKITYSYPDGPRDAETLLLDPVTKDLFIISKELDKANIYRLAYPQSTSATITAEKIGTIPSVVFTTDGSISYDGSEILIRNYTSVFYWQRKSGETIDQTLLQAPKKTLITAAEPQAEGITF